jgi:hypothetical protein
MEEKESEDVAAAWRAVLGCAEEVEVGEER